MQFSKYSLIPSCETICNLLHSLKTSLETSKLVNVQTYLKTFSRALVAKCHIAELHICNRKKWTYMILNTARAIYANTKIAGVQNNFKTFLFIQRIAFSHF
jgi:hypothetical protein